jgi:hypothetical protein
MPPRQTMLFPVRLLACEPMMSADGRVVLLLSVDRLGKIPLEVNQSAIDALRTYLMVAEELLRHRPTSRQ